MWLRTHKNFTLKLDRRNSCFIKEFFEYDKRHLFVVRRLQIFERYITGGIQLDWENGEGLFWDEIINEKDALNTSEIGGTINKT